ncbi:hypothetical protein Tco_0843067 [Tanacetum coccineum]|uniref:Uncharacterized protein n=1 Tax=Tanacetum coccineum TaxID=301880 RepID=A0ABQ5B1J7_9ASTR
MLLQSYPFSNKVLLLLKKRPKRKDDVKIRFGGNDAIRKTQKTLLKPDVVKSLLQCSKHIIVEQEVKRTVTSSSNSNLNSQNMAFVSSPNSTNEVNTANVQVSTANSPVSTADTLNSTANLCDATVYVFLANQLNGSQFVHEDLEQIHEDDLEEMDLKWQLALLSMRARRYFQRTIKKITINGSDTARYDKSKVECYNCNIPL